MIVLSDVWQMSGEESSGELAASTNSAIHSFAEDDMRANQEHEQVQMLEVEKKRLEIEIEQLEREIAADGAESFSRDQLATVKSELEHNCNQLFAQRTNTLLVKLEEAKTERQVLERRAASLKRTLQNEQKLTRQLVEERSAQRTPRMPALPECVLPELSTLRESYLTAHRKRALEEEVREAERELAQRRQSIAENESKLTKVIQDNKAKSAQCEAQIRSETLELAQLEEMRSSLRERIEETRQKQKQLEHEKRMLTTQIETSEASQRTKIDEIQRNFIAAQREFDEVRARKKAEIRELTRQLHENEELNRQKLQEKELLLQEIQARAQQPSEPPKPRKAKQKKATPRAPLVSVNSIALQAEIEQLQGTKSELTAKIQDLQRKAAANERKLESVKEKLERKVAESEAQIRRVRTAKERPFPPSGFASDDALSLNSAISD
jgi:chromosome segregation ATPase